VRRKRLIKACLEVDDDENEEKIAYSRRVD
jgi:hypothetical protein